MGLGDRREAIQGAVVGGAVPFGQAFFGERLQHDAARPGVGARGSRRLGGRGWTFGGQGVDQPGAQRAHQQQQNVPTEALSTNESFITPPFMIIPSCWTLNLALTIIQRRMHEYAEQIMALVRARNPAEPESQAVLEVVESTSLVIERGPEYRAAKIMERLVEPERVIIFRVPWMDDQGEIQINRGFRVQMNSAIGPYKGGLRFHPSVNLGILKFLAFEQVFKNSLTTLPMGGGKGGADFDPKGKSDGEVMRFCQSFMNELFRHIGPDTDIPAGDIGVGGREIGYLGQYKRLRNEFSGVLTGKGLNWGGSLHPAGGHRLRVHLPGCGDAGDAGRDPRGQDLPRLRKRQRRAVRHRQDHPVGRQTGDCLRLQRLHLRRRGHRPGQAGLHQAAQEPAARPHQEYADTYPSAVYTPCDPLADHSAQWDLKADCAFPAATQNEINEKDADNLLRNGVYVVAEGANMPTTVGGVKVFLDAGILYAPGKAANAGGVATSGLEMSQNSMRLNWPRDEVDARLHQIMKSIHKSCVDAAAAYGTPGNYVNGANIAGFLKVANAMMDQGLV